MCIDHRIKYLLDACDTGSEVYIGEYDPDSQDLPGVSFSKQDALCRSVDYLINNFDKPETQEMIFGRYIHDFLFMGEEYISEHYMISSVNSKDPRKTVKFKEEQVSTPNFELMTLSESTQGIAMINSLRKHPEVKAIMSEGYGEVSLAWRDIFSLVRNKGRLDWIREDFRDGWLVADLKTCKDARAQSVAKSMANYLYHVQSAMYIEAVSQVYGVDREKIYYYLIFIEKEPPYAVQVYPVSLDAISVGRNIYLQNMLKVKKWVEEYHPEKSDADKWYGYSLGNEALELPYWARNGV